MNTMQWFLLLALCAFAVAAVEAAPAANSPKKTRRNRYASLMHDFGVFQRKLQQRGLINSIDEGANADSSVSDGVAPPSHPQQNLQHRRRPSQQQQQQQQKHHLQRINELEMLQLIPLLIDELQAGRIEAGERRMLSTLYGTLWELIEDEVVARARHQDGDQVLADLLRALRQLEANGGRLVPAKGEKKDERFVNLWNRSDGVHVGGDEEPAQRLLKMVAILIHANRGAARR